MAKFKVGDKVKCVVKDWPAAEVISVSKDANGNAIYGVRGQSGMWDEDILTAANAVEGDDSISCNAKFKKGDKVRPKEYPWAETTVRAVLPGGKVRLIYGDGIYDFKEDDVEACNSRACNSEWVLAPKSSASGSYITVKDIGYKDAHKTKKVVVDGNVFWYSPEHAALVKQWVDFQKSKGKSVTTNAISCNTTIDPHVKDVLGDVFGRYKAAVIDYATRARDKYQLEANQLSSKMTGNGDGGEALKAVQEAIKKVFAEVYSTNGIKIQW